VRNGSFCKSAGCKVGRDERAEVTLGAGTREATAPEASEAAEAVCWNAAGSEVTSPVAGSDDTGVSFEPMEGLTALGSVLGGVPGCLEASKRGLPKSPEPTGMVAAEETDRADGETEREGECSWYGRTGGV